jgi:phage shock protein C
MTRKWNRYGWGLRRSRYGWLLGVCAGVAEFLGLRTWAVRLIALIALWIWMWPTLAVYAGLGLVMRPAPTAVPRWHGRWACDRH